MIRSSQKGILLLVDQTLAPESMLLLISPLMPTVTQLAVTEPGIQTHWVPLLLKAVLSPTSETSFDLIC